MGRHASAVTRVNGRPSPNMREKNYCFATAVRPKVYSEQKQIEHDWNEGSTFQVYQSHHTVGKADCLRLRMAGFTHVMVVWQDPNNGNAVMGCEIDLAFS